MSLEIMVLFDWSYQIGNPHRLARSPYPTAPKKPLSLISSCSEYPAHYHTSVVMTAALDQVRKVVDTLIDTSADHCSRVEPALGLQCWSLVLQG